MTRHVLYSSVAAVTLVRLPRGTAAHVLAQKPSSDEHESGGMRRIFAARSCELSKRQPAGLNATKRRTKHDFEYSDTNKDGKLTLAEYVAELLPGTFHGNETVAEVEASPAWKETENDWVLNSKVQHGLSVL